jgi:isopentenyldiphosphate isomerase
MPRVMEMFQLVDRQGCPTGEAPRYLCHGNPSLTHLVIHLHLFDADGRLYLQKRDRRKDTNPGLWDTSVGGHVSAGESVEAALLREAREELDVDASGARPLYGFLHENAFESEYARCFSLVWTGPVKPNPEEIEEGRFFTLAEVEAMVGTGTLTPLFEIEWPMLERAFG